MVKNNNNTLIIILIVVLALAFFGGYGMMGFSGGHISRYYGLSWVFGIISLLCAIWVIYDVFVNNKGLSDGMKVLWIIFAVFFSIITAIIYYFVGRNSNMDLFNKRRTGGNRR